jgi:Ca-activated chloride channel family protein
MPGTSETMIGVWVDVPTAARQKVPSSAVALVVDTSGSMSGSKIEHARAAANALVKRLPDGSLVGLYSFSDEVHEHLPLTSLNMASRDLFASVAGTLRASGSTNLFEGLRTAERSVFAAPATHPVKRIVLVSDGKANVGPSSPEMLGALAARGEEHGIQVTAVGVGLDYDESTLNALAMRSSGRLYHLTESRDLTAILQEEMGLLQATAATGAYVDIVPAPGVEILATENARSTVVNGATRVALGSMFAGQHREVLVKVRVNASADGEHPLASVRLHFRDPSDGNLERVQETVARYRVTRDAGEIAARQNPRTREILAVAEAGKLAAAAAEKAAQGDAEKAARDLARAEESLLAQARAAKDEAERRRLTSSATNITKARKATEAAAAAPAAARPKAARAAALEANEARMRTMGY